MLPQVRAQRDQWRECGGEVAVKALLKVQARHQQQGSDMLSAWGWGWSHGARTQTSSGLGCGSVLMSPFSDNLLLRTLVQVPKISWATS